MPAAGGMAHELAAVGRPIDSPYGNPIPDRKHVLQRGDQVRKSPPVLQDTLAVLGWATERHIEWVVAGELRGQEDGRRVDVALIPDSLEKAANSAFDVGHGSTLRL